MTPLNVQGPALPALLGVSANTVQARLRADAPLVRSGLVSVDSDADLKALDRLNRLTAAPAGSGTDVHRLLLDAAPASELDWSDFDHVTRDRDHIEKAMPRCSTCSSWSRTGYSAAAPTVEGVVPAFACSNSSTSRSPIRRMNVSELKLSSMSVCSFRGTFVRRLSFRFGLRIRRVPRIALSVYRARLVVHDYPPLEESPELRPGPRIHRVRGDRE